MLSFISVFYKHLANQAPKAVSYLIGSSILLILLLFLKQYTGLWLFEASIDELKGWYPRFYFFIFYGLKILLYIPYGILLFQSFWVYHLSKIKWWELSFLLIFSSISLYFFDSSSWLILFSATILLIYFLYLYINTIPNSHIKRTNKKENWLIFCFIILAFIVRLIWLLNSDNSGNGDAGMRLQETKWWVELFNYTSQNPSSIKQLFHYYLMPSTDWLPLHHYLIGITYFFTNDWVIAPRILTASFGALTIIPLYKLCKLKFNQLTAIIASVILIFYGYHIFLSTLTMSEVIYSFFILWSYYLIEIWCLTQEKKKLFFLSICLVALCWLRYEGWFISFFIILLLPLISRINNWKIYSLFSFVVSLAIIYIMVLEVVHGFHPLKGILYSDHEVKIAIANQGFSYRNIINEYSLSYLPFTFLCILIYLFQLIKTKQLKPSLIFLLYLLPLLPFTFKVMNGTLTAQARYLTIYMIPLISYTAYFMSSFIRLGKFTLISIISFYIIILNFTFFHSIIDDKILIKYKEEYHKSIRFIKTINNAKVYLDTEEGFGEYNWRVLANTKSTFLPINYLINDLSLDSNKKVLYKEQEAKLLRSSHNIFISSVDLDKDDYNNWDSTIFNQLFDQNKITHIVTFPDGKLQKILKNNNQYRNKKIIEVFNMNNYIIYEIYE